MRNVVRMMVVVLAITVVVLFLFLTTWRLTSDFGDYLGREVKGGVTFGITTYYGFWLFSFLSLAGNFVGGFLKFQKIRKFGIWVSLLIWVYWCWPSVSAYPIRGICFLIYGVLFYCLGNVASNKLSK